MAGHAHRGTASVVPTLQQVINDGSRRVLAAGQGLRPFEIVLAILGVIGLVAIIAKAATAGFSELEPWGYTALAFGYLLSSVLAAPILAILLRLTRSNWRRPISRIAEIAAVAGIVPLILFIPLLIVMPSAEERFTLWVNWPWGAPHVFDLVFLILVICAGYALLYFSSMPDFAVARDRLDGNNGRGRWYRRLARDWQGTARQWVILRTGLGVLGGIYIMLYVWTVSQIYSDFALTLVPGWRSAVFPGFAALSSLQTGLALIIVMMYVFRRWGGLGEYLEWEYFWSISKILLAVSLLWFYLWFSEFMIFWYGRTPSEQNILELVMFNVYFVPFLLTFVMNFAGPLLILMWNRVRKTVIGPTVVACLVLVGTFLDRLRIFGAAFSMEESDLSAHELETVPGFLAPGIFDVLIIIGAFSAAALLILLAVRVVPLPSIWEVGSGLPLKVRRRYYDTEVTLIAKPD